MQNFAFGMEALNYHSCDEVLKVELLETKQTNLLSFFNMKLTF